MQIYSVDGRLPNIFCGSCVRGGKKENTKMKKEKNKLKWTHLCGWGDLEEIKESWFISQHSFISCWRSHCSSFQVVDRAKHIHNFAVRGLPGTEAHLGTMTESVLAAQLKKIRLSSYILGYLSVQLPGCTTKVSETYNNNQFSHICYKLWMVPFTTRRPALFSWRWPFCEDSLSPCSHAEFLWVFPSKKRS